MNVATSLGELSGFSDTPCSKVLEKRVSQCRCLGKTRRVRYESAREREEHISAYIQEIKLKFEIVEIVASGIVHEMNNRFREDIRYWNHTATFSIYRLGNMLQNRRLLN